MRKLFIVKETYSIGGGKRIPSTTFETERIEIGDDVYVRNAPGNWLKNPEEQDSSNPRRATSLVSEPKTFLYRYLGKKELNGKFVDSYESTLAYEYKFSENDILCEKQIETMWLDDAGRFLKIESSTTDDEGFVSSRTTKLYEYPDEINIEAPIK